MTDFTGLALVIGAILTPLSVMFNVWITNRIAKVQQEEKAAAVETKAVVDETLATTTLIHHGVNGREEGDPTLSEDVATIKDKQEADSPSDAQPSELVVTKSNGNASLRLQMAYLTKIVEELKAKSA